MNGRKSHFSGVFAGLYGRKLLKTKGQWTSMPHVLLCPVLPIQTFDPGELAHVCSHQCQAVSQCLSGHQKVIGANRLSSGLQICATAPATRESSSSNERIKNGPATNASTRFRLCPGRELCHSVPEFEESDRGNKNPGAGRNAVMMAVFDKSYLPINNHPSCPT